MKACACDIRCTKDEQEKVRDYFQSNQSNIEFDQLILYWKYGQRFVHIGVSQDTKGRKMIPEQDIPIRNRKLQRYPKGASYVEV